MADKERLLKLVKDVSENKNISVNKISEFNTLLTRNVLLSLNKEEKEKFDYYFNIIKLKSHETKESINEQTEFLNLVYKLDLLYKSGNIPQDLIDSYNEYMCSGIISRLDETCFKIYSEYSVNIRNILSTSFNKNK